MNHFLTMLLALEGSAPQATLTSPPAIEMPVRRQGKVKTSFRFMASVVANAAGFGMLLAGCWFSLQLMQVILHL